MFVDAREGRNAWRELHADWRNLRRARTLDGCTIAHVRTTLFFAAVLMVAAPARAQTKDECIAASENAQRFRDQHKPIEARAQFIVCARATCPDAIKSDCTDQVQKIADKIPTVVVRAKRSGSDVVDATLTIDGAVAASRLDGTPITLDPGVHDMRVDASGAAPIERKVVVVEGEHDRVFDFVLGVPAVVVDTPHKHFPVGAAIFTGLTVAAFGVFAPFAILGANDFDAAKKTCAPTCPDATVDPIRTKLLVADISLGVGIAAGVTAIVLYIAHFAGGSTPSRAAMTHPLSLSF